MIGMFQARRCGRLAIAGASLCLAASTVMAVAEDLAGPVSDRPGPASIGVARQEADGTLVLTLRAEDGDGAVGDGQFRYAPSSPDYAAIAAHLDPIPPGGSVVVRPFEAAPETSKP